MVFAHKRTNHAGARKTFAADKRDAIELCLQLLVVGNAARHDKPKHQADSGRADQKDDAELKVDGKGRDHGAHRQERPADEHAHAQRHGKLDLVDVVGDACDERGRAKAVELGIAQLVDVLVECAANVSTHALRGERRHLLADERKRDADHSHGAKYHAVVDNGINVVRANALIDHLAITSGVSRSKITSINLHAGPITIYRRNLPPKRLSNSIIKRRSLSSFTLNSNHDSTVSPKEA